MILKKLAGLGLLHIRTRQGYEFDLDETSASKINGELVEHLAVVVERADKQPEPISPTLPATEGSGTPVQVSDCYNRISLLYYRTY